MCVLLFNSKAYNLNSECILCFYTKLSGGGSGTVLDSLYAGGVGGGV